MIKYMGLTLLFTSIVAWASPHGSNYSDGQYIGQSISGQPDNSDLRLTHHYPGYYYSPSMTESPNSAAPGAVAANVQIGAVNLFSGPPVVNYTSIRNAAETNKVQAQALEKETQNLKSGIDAAKSAPIAPVHLGVTLADDLIGEYLAGLDTDLPTPENSLSFQLYSPPGEFRDKLATLGNELNKISPNSDTERQLRELGLVSVQESDVAYSQGDTAEADFWYDLGKEVLDITVGINPTTGLAQSFYELTVGKSIFTGADLTTFDRSIAFLGVVSGGLSKGIGSVAKIGSVVTKVVSRAGRWTKDSKIIETAIRDGSRIADTAAVVDLSAKVLRNGPGTGIVSKALSSSDKLLRGTHGNAGIVTKEIGEKLAGKSFSNFKEFKDAFWKATAESRYAGEFSVDNLNRMRKGNSPLVQESQSLGKRIRYELHHMEPIHQGGNVYDVSNIMVTTPRFHKEVLLREYHYGK
jgi:hypothetical protein